MQQDLNPQDIIDEIKQYEKRLIDFRRRVHREPEVGFDTALTLKKIAEFLKENGIEGLDTAASPGSGFLLIQGSKPGKTIALPISMRSISPSRAAVRGLQKTEWRIPADMTVIKRGCSQRFFTSADTEALQAISSVSSRQLKKA